LLDSQDPKLSIVPSFLTMKSGAKRTGWQDVENRVFPSPKFDVVVALGGGKMQALDFRG
jgi:hypothetical protein